MKKTKIYAAGNENIKGDYNVSYYIIEKDNNFLNWLSKALVQVLEIREGDKKARFIVKIIDDSTNVEELILKDINQMIDLHEHYEKEGERIDLFYGKNRVYLTFRKSKECRKKFAKFLLNTKEWIDIKENAPKEKKEIIT